MTGDDAGPTTLAEADAQNVVGRENRARVNLSGYGGRTSEELDLINYQTQVNQQRQQVQDGERQQRKQEEAVVIATMMDRYRASGFTGMMSGQETYDRIMGYEQAPVQERTYLENLQNRPRYTPESMLGDTETQRRAAAGENIGQVLESQRKYAESTPGTRDDQYYLNELSKWNANAIERSSEYHHETLATGQQQKANPYENRGDVALAFEKGGNLKDFTVDKYGFNQNVGVMTGREQPMKYSGWERDAESGTQLTRNVGGLLPGGQGLQETAWGVAKSGKASNVNFREAIDYQISQEGRYGPYGSLYGGVVDKPVESGGSPVSREPIGNARLAWGGNVQNQQQTPTGDKWNPFVASAAEPIGYISEGIQYGNTTKKSTFVNPVKPDGTFVGNALAGQFTPAQQEAIDPISKISQTISGGVNFAFSIPVGVASLLTLGTIPQWAPKDLEVVVPSKDPIKETIVYGTPTTTFSGGNQTITNLGTQIGMDKEKIAAYDADINTLLQGKIIDGKYAGTPEGFTIVSEKIAARNELAGTITTNVDTYNAMQKENPIIETTTTPQTVIQTGTPDKVYRFGYWQKASEEFGNKTMGALGYNREQLETYGTTLKNKPGIGGEAERFVYNVMKPAIESPMDLPVYYLEGKMLAGAFGGAGEVVTQYGQQGTGKLATVAKVLTTPGEGGIAGSAARGLTKWGLPAMFVVGTGYEVTNKGTDFSKETVVTNLESGVMPMALMTYGAMGTEPVRGAVDYGKTRFAEKPMVRQTFEGELKYEQRPDVMVQSGIGGNIQYTQTTTLATQPSFLGVSFPRIFNPIERGSPIKTTVDMGYGDTGRLISDRLPGATSNPVVGSRTESLVLEQYRSGNRWVQEGPYQYVQESVAVGKGNIKIAEVRLPRTMDEYLKMGAEYAKLGVTKTIPPTPEPQPGYIRMYRGEKSLTPIDAIQPSGSRVLPKDTAGRWFTQSLDKAKGYQKQFGGEDGIVSYVDVPKSMGKGQIIESSEHLLPKDMANTRKLFLENEVKIKLSPEEMTAQLMADAAKVTEPVTGYRELSVTVPAGTPIRQAFDWNIAKQGGTQVEFNKNFELEDYFGSMKVQQTGGGQSDYSVVVTRDIGEQGFLKGGSYDVTGSQVPETKVIRQLQEVSKNTKPMQNEVGFGFNSRGDLVSEIIGNAYDVDYFPAKQKIIGEKGTSGYFAHSHPNFFPESIWRGVKGDILLNDWKFTGTRKVLSNNAQQSLWESYPSKIPGQYAGDIVVFAEDANLGFFNVHGNVNAEIVVSKAGVRVFRPDATRGWDIFNDVQNAPPRTDMPGATSLQKADATFKEIGVDTTFVKANERYNPTGGYTERIPDATAEMQSSYPAGIRTQIVDIVDRMTLKDPNLEFVRESAIPKEKSLSPSGSNLGRGGSGVGSNVAMSSGRVSQVQIITLQQSVERATMTAQPQMFATPPISKAPSGQVPRQITEPVLSFQQGQGQFPRSKQDQKIEKRFLIEPVNSFAQPNMQVPRQDAMKEYARVFKIGTGFKLTQTPEQTTTPVSTQGVWQTPLQGQQQTPIQEQGQIQRQQQIPRIQPPPQLGQQIYERPPLPPEGGIPFLPSLPYLPSGSGGYGTKRRGRRFWEYFPIGLDISTRISQGGARGHTRKKKGKLIPKKWGK